METNVEMWSSITQFRFTKLLSDAAGKAEFIMLMTTSVAITPDNFVYFSAYAKVIYNDSHIGVWEWASDQL